MKTLRSLGCSAAVLTIFVLGCSKENPLFPYDPNNPIIGAWKLSSQNFLGYDIHSGAEMYSNYDETDSDNIVMLTQDGTVYWGRSASGDNRMNVATYEYRNDSLFFNGTSYANRERQAVLELGREVLRTEYMTDDGSEDGTMDIVRVTYARIED